MEIVGRSPDLVYISKWVLAGPEQAFRAQGAVRPGRPDSVSVDLQRKGGYGSGGMSKDRESSLSLQLLCDMMVGMAIPCSLI